MKCASTVSSGSWLLLVLLLFGAAANSAEKGRSALPPPLAVDISGDWRLDPESSGKLMDNLEGLMAHERHRDGMRLRREPEGGPDGMPGMGGPEGGPDDMPGTGGPGNGSRNERREGPGLRDLDAQKLHIEQKEPEINITYDDAVSRTIFTDGRGTIVTASGKVSSPMGSYIAGWTDAGILRVETHPGNGMTLVEKFSPSPDHGRLQIVITIISDVTGKSVDTTLNYVRS